MNGPASDPGGGTGGGEPTREGELHRLHPLSPLLRGWKFVVAVLVVVVPQNLDAFSPGPSGSPGSPGDRFGSGFGRLAASALLLIVVGGVYGVLSWRFTRYGIEGGDLRIDTGVVFRNSRRVRLDRLQAVDVVQPLLGRALGLAELRLEVVGGGKTEAPLAYLSLPDAGRLRAELLARAAGIAEDTPEAPERVLHEVPAERLLWSSLLSTPVVVGVVLVPVALGVSAVTAGIGAVLVLVPAVVSIGAPLVQQLVTNYGFTLAESPDGLRIRRGLLETRSQTVPPGRIQAVRVAEPWLWRRFTDWVAVEVDIAGYAQERGSGSALLLPVGPRRMAADMLARVLPGAEVTAVTLHGVPERAVWLAPLTRRVLAAGADDRFFVARRGFLRRETDIMPHERTQSVRATQGPLQRLLGLASVTLDTTPGPVVVRAEHRDAVEAVGIVSSQAELARRARAVTLPDRWMAPPFPPVDGSAPAPPPGDPPPRES